MQNRRIHLLVAMIIAALVVLGGCETLGLASPFSDGADAFSDAQYDWGDKEYSSALRNAALAIYYDEKHYGAYQFIVEKYDEGMEKIHQQMEELAAGEPTVESVAREVRIYVDLADFVDSLDDGTDPRVLTFRKEQIEIPMTDYTPRIAEARSRGYELAVAAGTAQLESGDVDAAGDGTVVDGLTVGAFYLDLRTFTVSKYDRPLPMRKKLFDLFLHFARNPDVVVSKESLYANVWDVEDDISDNSLYVHIHQLRARIEDDPSHPVHLKTVRGLGFSFHPAGRSR